MPRCAQYAGDSFIQVLPRHATKTSTPGQKQRIHRSLLDRYP